jgi:hypothetical protein
MWGGNRGGCVRRTYNHVIMAGVRYNVGLQRKSQVSNGIEGRRIGGDMLAIFVVEPLW